MVSSQATQCLLWRLRFEEAFWRRDPRVFFLLHLQDVLRMCFFGSVLEYPCEKSFAQEVRLSQENIRAPETGDMDGKNDPTQQDRMSEPVPISTQGIQDLNKEFAVDMNPPRNHSDWSPLLAWDPFLGERAISNRRLRRCWCVWEMLG